MTIDFVWYSLHTFIFQHLEYTSDDVTVNYIVSGSANFVEASLAHKDAVPADSLKFYWADTLSLGGFTYVDVSKSNMTVHYLRADGTELHQAVMQPRKI